MLEKKTLDIFLFLSDIFLFLSDIILFTSKRIFILSKENPTYVQASAELWAVGKRKLG